MKHCCKRKCSDKKAKWCLTSGRFIDYYNYGDQFDGDQAPVQGGGDMGGGDAGGAMGESDTNIEEGNSKDYILKLKQLAAAAKRGDAHAMSKLKALSGAIGTGVDYKHLAAVRGVANKLSMPAPKKG